VVDAGKDNNDPRNNDLDPNGGDDDLGREKCDGGSENDHNRPRCVGAVMQDFDGEGVI
jgi:hypothetical protein